MARDQATIDGDAIDPNALAALAEPVLVETVKGSFGLRIARAPAIEQISFLRESLFNRTVDRLVEIFRVARDTTDPGTIARSFFVLRKNSVNGFQKLALVMAGASAPTRLRWRGEEVIAVTPATASMIVDALSAVHIEEDTMDVVGVLSGADVVDERFHLIEDAAEGQRPRHYRGNVDPEAVPALRTAFGSRARAKLTVVRTESDFLGRPRIAYVLSEVRPLGGVS
jgi:hypothetical protein